MAAASASAARGLAVIYLVCSLIVIAFVVGVACGFVIGIAELPVVETPEIPEASPVPMPAPKAELPQPVAAHQKKVQVRLVSGSGRRVLEVLDILEAARRPTLRVGHDVFAASHLGDDGVWVYRRVGTEKKA